MSTCGATANPRPGVTLRCDRQAGHEDIRTPDEEWHYDFHQDAEWRADETPWITVEYRTVRK